MKTTKLITILAFAGLMGVGCSKTESQAPNTNTNTNTQIGAGAIIIDPTVPGLGSGGSVGFANGATVNFSPTSLDVMNDYVATHRLNYPTNIKINVNLSQVESGRYGGAVTISYMDNGIQYNGVFNAGMGRNQAFKGMYDNNSLESAYNYWFNYQNQLVFSGFFQDSFGAITITLIPETTTTGTGGNDAEPTKTSTTYKGSIYYKNFMVQSNPYVGGNQTATMAQQSQYRSCWYTYMGPYDCRSNIIQTKCGLTPGSEAGYKLLGTFTGLNIKQAFNIK